MTNFTCSQRKNALKLKLDKLLLLFFLINFPNLALTSMFTSPPMLWPGIKLTSVQLYQTENFEGRSTDRATAAAAKYLDTFKKVCQK